MTPVEVVDTRRVFESDDEVCRAVERAQAGDRRGFEVLFRMLGRSVVGYLRRWGVRDPEWMANGVFERAFRRIDGFDGDGRHFRSFIFTIANHAAVDEARRWRVRVKEVPLTWAYHEARSDLEDEVMCRLARQRVEVLLGELSADQREVLVLRLGGLSLSETAAVLGKKYDTVKTLQRRGLNVLRAALCAEGWIAEAPTSAPGPPP